jgi:hypothetical protein
MIAFPSDNLHRKSDLEQFLMTIPRSSNSYHKWRGEMDKLSLADSQYAWPGFRVFRNFFIRFVDDPPELWQRHL